MKQLYGYNAKKEGQKLRDDRKDVDGLFEEDKQAILEAIRCKLRQNKYILKLLTYSNLPFTHYYAYGDTKSGYNIHFLPQYDWIVDEIERLRVLCKNHYRR